MRPQKSCGSFGNIALPITNHQSLITMWLFWALLSALFAGLTAVFAKIGVVSINSNLATAIRTTIIVVITWGIALSTSRVGDLLRLPGRSWLFLFLSAIATGLSWLCYFRALQLGEVVKVAPIDKLSVVVVIVISVLFLGERLSARETFGVGLIVCGALFLAWK
jgi:bacterial/archaeal transporter family protein